MHHFMNNYTPSQLFAILLRIFALDILWNALIDFTYFPAYWMRSDVAHGQAGIAIHSSYDVSLIMLYARFGLHVVIGMYLLAQPHALAARLSKGVLRSEP
jgi:hypothetical protein